MNTIKITESHKEQLLRRGIKISKHNEIDIRDCLNMDLCGNAIAGQKESLNKSVHPLLINKPTYIYVYVNNNDEICLDDELFYALTDEENNVIKLDTAVLY